MRPYRFPLPSPPYAFLRVIFDRFRNHDSQAIITSLQIPCVIKLSLSISISSLGLNNLIVCSHTFQDEELSALNVNLTNRLVGCLFSINVVKAAYRNILNMPFICALPKRICSFIPSGTLCRIGRGIESHSAFSVSKPPIE